MLGFSLKIKALLLQSDSELYSTCTVPSRELANVFHSVNRYIYLSAYYILGGQFQILGTFQ